MAESKSTKPATEVADQPRTPVEFQHTGRAGDRIPEGADDPGRPLVGESSDPVVHQLLATRADAQRNGDTEMVRGIDKRLADMGYVRREGDSDGG